MTPMKIKNTEFTVIIERDEDGVFVGSVPAIAGCHSQAKTIPTLLKRTKEAIKLCLEAGEEVSPLKFVGLQEIEVKS